MIPLLLFDLDIDPDEIADVSHHPDYAEILDAMLSEARAIWDPKALRDCIIKDQNRRRLINRSHKIGAAPVWDYQPYEDASKQFVRAGKWTTEVEAKAHLDTPRSSN